MKGKVAVGKARRADDDRFIRGNSRLDIFWESGGGGGVDEEIAGAVGDLESGIGGDEGCDGFAEFACGPKRVTLMSIKPGESCFNFFSDG